MVDDLRRYRTDVEDSARWEQFVFRDGDIVISAPSKTGTTWTQMICALLIFGTPDLPAPLTTLSPWLDTFMRPVDEVIDRLEAQQHRRFVKTHTPLDGVPRDPRVTYLALCRDPRDVAVSLMYQGENLKRDVISRLVGEDAQQPQQPAASATAPMRERLRRWMTLPSSPTTTLDTLDGLCWQMSRAWERRDQPNVVLVHYSDLSADLDGQMRRLARLLEIDVPEPAWPGLVEAAGFDRMHQRAADLVPDERLGIMKDPQAFFRRGSTGGWEQWLTDEDVRIYDDRLAELVPPDLAAYMRHGAAADSSAQLRGIPAKATQPNR